MYINWSLNSGYISNFPYSYITTTHGITVGTITVGTLQNYLDIPESRNYKRSASLMSKINVSINIILNITNLNNFKDIYEKMYIYLCFNINILYILHTYLVITIYFVTF